MASTYKYGTFDLHDLVGSEWEWGPRYRPVGEVIAALERFVAALHTLPATAEAAVEDAYDAPSTLLVRARFDGERVKRNQKPLMVVEEE